MQKSVLILFFLIILINLLFCSDLSNDENKNEKLILKKEYDEEKLSYTTKKYFDIIYPDFNKNFSFFKGSNKITTKEFESLTNDPLIIKNNALIKETKLAGFTAAIVLGVTSTSFLIPSIIFVALQTQYFNKKDTLKEYGYTSWMDYFIAKYPEYFLPGLICIGLTVATSLAILVDLSVTFAILHKYQNNERIIKEVIERYNKKLREKLKVIPDFGFNMQSDIVIGFSTKF